MLVSYTVKFFDDFQGFETWTNKKKRKFRGVVAGKDRENESEQKK